MTTCMACNHIVTNMMMILCMGSLLSVISPAKSQWFKASHPEQVRTKWHELARNKFVK